MIPPGAGEVTVRDIAVSEYHYPFTGEAAFSSSDPELDRLYQAGIRTTEMNSFDAFTDCPTREQRAWVGDGVVHQMVHLVANEDWRLARNYVTLGASPRPDGMLPMTVTGEIEYQAGYTIPDWALHWIHGVWNLFRHDGDRAATLRLLPVVERVLRWYEPYIDDHGTLSDVPEWNLIDWSSVFSSARSSLITGLWARGLAEYAEMADWLGNTASAAWARGLWEQARQGYEDFWDPARGSYVDHIVDGERQPAMSQAAGAVAIVSGLAPQRPLGRHRRRDHRPRPAGGPVLDRRRGRRLRHDQDRRALPGDLPDRLGCRPRDRAGRTVLQLRRARRGRRRRPERPATGPAAAMECVPARRLRHLRRMLGLGHTRPRLERHPDQGPDLVRARRHPRRTRLRHRPDRTTARYYRTPGRRGAHPTRPRPGAGRQRPGARGQPGAGDLRVARHGDESTASAWSSEFRKTAQAHTEVVATAPEPDQIRHAAG